MDTSQGIINTLTNKPKLGINKPKMLRNKRKNYL